MKAGCASMWHCPSSFEEVGSQRVKSEPRDVRPEVRQPREASLCCTRSSSGTLRSSVLRPRGLLRSRRAEGGTEGGGRKAEGGTPQLQASGFLGRFVPALEARIQALRDSPCTRFDRRSMRVNGCLKDISRICEQREVIVGIARCCCALPLSLILRHVIYY